jgi:NTE family protein
MVPDVTRFRAQLERHWLFEGADDDVRAKLFEQVQLLEVPAYRLLMREGDPSDGMHIVLSGRLRAERGRGRERRVLGEIGRDELIGETSMLMSDAPRNATVVAIRDSVLASLSIEGFHALAKNVPDLWRRIGSFALQRATRKAPPSSALTLTLWPLGAPGDLDALAEHMAAALSAFGTTRVLRAETGSGPDRQRIADAEQAVDRLILVADDEESA